MDPLLIRTLIPVDYRPTLEAALLAIAGGNDAMIDQINDMAGGASGPPSNQAPTINGSPATSILAGSSYSFTPNASDPDGDALSFSISGRPSWTSFDSTTGRLSGTTSAGNVGTHGNIVISVSDGQYTANLQSFSITVTTSNTAPSISGNPDPQAYVNNNYSFTPSADDPDGDSLSFSITGLPGWANFNTSNGRLNGTPSNADVNTYDNIRITVSDGSASANLAAFSITVNAIGTGSVTLTWTPPTENEDGSTLTDLAGYRIYWGTTPGSYPASVTINNPGISSYVISGLALGTYEFVATSFNAAGVESVHSNSVTKAAQ
jgi:hypothetical protein